MQKITSCLWFDNNAEEAVNFYRSVFKDVKVGLTTHYGDFAPSKKGTVLTIWFEMLGMQFMALNGGPHFKFNEAISLMVNCKDQNEIDYYWEKLAEGGSYQECGWLKDRFGVSWQIVPAGLTKLLNDPKKAENVLAAVMQMVKLDIATLEAAAKG
jgi:predicted 3-demethylubiquinone-9 3-methyltransferase (glyoxalase superfamily)